MHFRRCLLSLDLIINLKRGDAIVLISGTSYRRQIYQGSRVHLLDEYVDDLSDLTEYHFPFAIEVSISEKASISSLVY